jgi:hypothetical protein
MEGIRFVTDESGKKIAEQLDLDRYGELWEAFYDQLLLEQRRDEKREPFAVVDRRLRKQGSLRG